MSEFEGLKKIELARYVRKLGLSVRSKDTKLNLLEKLNNYKEENPKGYEMLVESFNADDDTGSVTLVEEIGVTEDEDDDDDETDVADDDDSDDDKIHRGRPPLDLMEPMVNFFKRTFEKFYNCEEDLNDQIRLSLSSIVNLTYMELALEVVFFLYLHVPMVPLKDIKYLPMAVKNLISFSSHFPDLTQLLQFSVISIFLQWLFYAVLLPGVLSYYINFTRKVVVLETTEEDEDEEENDEYSFVVRLHKHDPVIFSLAKIVIFYFFVKSGAFIPSEYYDSVFGTLSKFLYVHMNFYRTFAFGLGKFPLVLGAANVVIGLYSQFEDF